METRWLILFWKFGKSDVAGPYGSKAEAQSAALDELADYDGAYVFEAKGESMMLVNGEPVIGEHQIEQALS